MADAIVPSATSRKEAKARGLARYSTGKPCKHGHIAERTTCDGGCVVCNREHGKRYQHTARGRAGRLRWAKTSYVRNREKIRVASKLYYERTKKQHVARGVAYRRFKYSVDPAFRMQSLLRSRIRYALSGKAKPVSVVKVLGCSFAQLKEYIENKFEPGMSWENHGDWHIDHKRPLSSFDLSNPDQYARACHFSNLQPLWARDNLSKGSKVNTAFGIRPKRPVSDERRQKISAALKGRGLGKVGPMRGKTHLKSSRQKMSLTKRARPENLIMFRGRAMCLSDWAQWLGISIQALGNRLKRGWPLERALTEPSRGY